MIAKIIKGAEFGGVINYMLSKQEGKAMVLASNNIGFTDQNLCVHEFALQASMRPNVQKPVCHTILSFSANDADQLTDDMMIKIANEYLEKMGYADTQSLIVRHSDRQHPHLHICINRIGNDGKTISDRNEKYRSTKVYRELTERYGLALGEGKKAIHRQQLRGEDKLRYEIFDVIKAVLPHSKNWKDFVAVLDKQGITIRFKTKGNTDVVQGIIFAKDGCSFSGSKIDRSYSFARLNETLNQNSQQQRYEELAQVSKEASEGSSNFLTELSEALGESFTLPTSKAGVDVDEIRFQKKLRNRANRQRKI